ncbi:MAG: hypothetical protein AAF368_07925 [Planctomycetota bacterium]
MNLPRRISLIRLGVLLAGLTPLACQSGPATVDFPFTHPDTAQALERRVSQERYEQRAEQLQLREEARLEDWLARQLWADGLPVWNRPGEFTVATIPAIDRSEKAFVALLASEADAGLILEAAGAWTTAMRAKNLPRPPLSIRFVVCHDENAPFSWMPDEDSAYLRGVLVLKSAESVRSGVVTYDAPSSPLLDSVFAGSEARALSGDIEEGDSSRGLSARSRAERPDLPLVSLQAAPESARDLVAVALRAILQLR